MDAIAGESKESLIKETSAEQKLQRMESSVVRINTDSAN